MSENLESGRGIFIDARLELPPRKCCSLVQKKSKKIRVRAGIDQK